MLQNDIIAARKHIDDLLRSGGRSWVLHVPAIDSDVDLVLLRIIDWAESAVITLDTKNATEERITELLQSWARSSNPGFSHEDCIIRLLSDMIALHSETKDQLFYAKKIKDSQDKIISALEEKITELNNRISELTHESK